MRRPVLRALLLVTALSVAGCGATPPDPRRTPPPSASAVTSPTPVSSPTRRPGPAPRRTQSPKPSQTPKPGHPQRSSRTPTPRLTPDPRNRFYTDDKTWYASPWFAGRHQIMVEYGCTPAPYYAPDPRCTDQHGFHHGVDIAMPCGTQITAGVNGRVISPDTPGTPGPAYGRTAFRIRTAAGRDVLIGHAGKVFVRPGDRVRHGEPIALAGARGAPDGCHLHLEVRPADGGVTDAVNPMRIAGLRP